MSLILFMDTSASEALLGLVEDGQWLQTKVLPDARQLGQTLHTEVAELLQNSGKTLQDLRAVAIVNGPGSYTGLRVGLAAAKGWCFGLDIPLITLNRLQILLSQFRKKEHISGNSLLLLPARAGEWFAFGADAEGGILLSARHVDRAALEAILDQGSFQKIVVAGAPEKAPTNITVAASLFMGDAIHFNGLETVVTEKFNEKRFAEITTAKPEYLKGVYIAS